MSIRPIVAFLAAVGVGLSAPAAPRASGALAASTPDCRVVAVEGGRTDVSCAPGFATERDRVLVYGRDGRAASATIGEPWQPEMLDETWVVDAGGRGRASLIIDFHPVGGDVAADLYDDTDGDGTVSELVTDGRLRIRENGGNWVMRVQAKDGWWVRDGKLNFNLDLTVNGPIKGTIDYDVYERLLRPGGGPYLLAHVRDPKMLGRPSYEWRQAYPPLDASNGFHRTTIMVNTLDDEVPLTPGGLPWPYLGGEQWDLVKPYFRSPAPIQVDWLNAKLTTLGEFVASRGKAGNYFHYSLSRVDEKEVSATDFENPFAFYSLADAPEDYPDLAVRMAHFPAGDLYVHLPVPTQQIDYSWRHAGLVDGGDPVWDYKLSLAGRHAVDTVTPIGPLRVRAVPYQELPQWVVSRPWDFATLVAREGQGYPSTEGLYEWYPLEGTDPGGRQYLAGTNSKSPLDVPYSEEKAAEIREYMVGRSPWIGVNLRAERTFAYGEAPKLYFSPIDHRLHLPKADYGIWNLDDRRYVRYDNLGGDYLNRWALFEGNTEVASLTFAADQLVLADRDGIRIKTVDAAPALFWADPPSNHDNWLSLGERLDEYESPVSGDDPLSMFEQFSGPEVAIPGATLDQVRVGSDGFAFLLQLDEPDATAADAIPGVEAGLSRVQYRLGQGYAAQPAQPARLEYQITGAAAADAPPLQPRRVTVVVHNAGDVDAADVAVGLRALLDGQAPQVIGRTQTSVLAGAESRVSFVWTPPSNGKWVLDVDAPDSLASLANRDAGTQPGSLLSIVVEPFTAAPHFTTVVMVLLLVVGGCAGWIWLRVAGPSSASRYPGSGWMNEERR
jgi:hypothetical protein